MQPIAIFPNFISSSFILASLLTSSLFQELFSSSWRFYTYLTVLVNTVTRLLVDLPPRDAIFHYFLQNNVGLGKCYQSRTLLITLTSTVIIPDITKTSPNNCLLSNRIGEQARWSERWDLAHSGFPAFDPQEKVLFLTIKQILYWPSLFTHDCKILAFFFFALLKELGQYPAILKTCLVDRAYLISTHTWSMFQEGSWTFPPPLPQLDLLYQIPVPPND